MPNPGWFLMFQCHVQDHAYVGKGTAIGKKSAMTYAAKDLVNHLIKNKHMDPSELHVRLLVLKSTSRLEFMYFISDLIKKWSSLTY